MNEQTPSGAVSAPPPDVLWTRIPGSNYGYNGFCPSLLRSPENTVAQGLLDESGST